MRAPSFRRLFTGLLVVLASLFLLADSAHAWRIVTWNLLNYAPGREAHYKAVLNDLQPDVLVVQEMQGGFGTAVFFLDQVLNAPDGPGGYQIATFTDGFGTDNALYYRTSTVGFAGNQDHIDIDTPLRDIDRWFIGPAGYSSDNAKLYVYSAHLKAGSSSSDENQRALEASLARNDANTLGPGKRFVYAGDFNLQGSFEAAWANLTGSQADNDGRAFDPINMPGSWSNNATFAGIHTQSPHNNNSGADPSATGGGMDDRFDFILVSNIMNGTSGLSYVDGTYRAYGNDGLHFNNDINDPPTIPEGSAIADALHGASDHLPVVADFRVPAVADAGPSLAYGTVIQGATASLDLNVTNVANLALFAEAANLTYSLADPAGFNAPGGAFVEPAGGGGNVHAVVMLTTTAGVKAGTLNVNSSDPDTPSFPVPCSGTVLRHAVPSLAAGSQVLTVPADFGAHVPGQFSDQQVDVRNFGFDSLQALLQVYDAQLSGPDAGSFSLVGGFAPFLVGGTPAPLTIAFDDSGSPGVYTADLVLSTRDQQDLAGATDLPDLTIQLTADLQPGVQDGGPFGTYGGPLRLVTVRYGGSSSGLALKGSGLTPGAQALLLAGTGRASVRIPECMGHRTGLASPFVLASPRADENGEVLLPLPVRLVEAPARLQVQLVDAAGCRVADPVVVARP